MRLWDISIPYMWNDNLASKATGGGETDRLFWSRLLTILLKTTF